MNTTRQSLISLAAAGVMLGACATAPVVPISKNSAVPGTMVSRRGTPVKLLGDAVSVGKPLPSTALVDAATMQSVDLARERGRVLFLNVVVSLDTGL
jgi:thiol peroxidase